MKRVILFLLGVFSRYIRPFLGGRGSCRFLPTCTEYSRQAIEKYGVFKGAWLSLTRLLRCHPFCKGGFDPVP